MMNMSAEGWEQYIAKISTLGGDVTNAVATALLEAAQNVQDRVQAEMPVDTGWAQARWGVPEYGGIWEVSEDGLSITQGASIDPYEYIIRLNEGSSTQAPAGFIDAAGEWGAQQADELISAKLETVDD